MEEHLAANPWMTWTIDNVMRASSAQTELRRRLIAEAAREMGVTFPNGEPEWLKPRYPTR